MTTVGFYVKAGTKTGYGHLIRCYALAGELKERGCECVFWTNQPAWLRDRGYDAFYLNGGGDLTPDVWIVDLEGGCSPSLARQLSEYCHVLVILNGVGYPDGDPG
jgi:spore coat polysaccharide biosynthesis predicted glycosyltransferase SpsG